MHWIGEERMVMHDADKTNFAVSDQTFKPHGG